MSVAEAYPLIENILREREKEAAFAHWLTAALSRAQVRVNPDLVADLLSPVSTRAAGRNGTSGGSAAGVGSRRTGENANETGQEEAAGWGTPLR